MTWFKVDDAFHSHPKVLATEPAALGLWVVAGAWSSANLTGGFVPDRALPRLIPDGVSLAKELVASGLWKRTKGGYLFHDWQTYNPTAEEARETKRKRAEAGRKGGLASGKSRSKPRSNSEANASGGASRFVEPPSPSRPEGTGTVQVVSQSSRRNVRAMGPDDDDSIDLAIVQLLTELTGRDVPILWASKVRQRILDGRKVDARMAYVLKSIRDNPDKFIPTADAAEPAPSLAVVPEWCGHCDERTRLLDLPDDTVARCPACHPLERRTA